MILQTWLKIQTLNLVLSFHFEFSKRISELFRISFSFRKGFLFHSMHGMSFCGWRTSTISHHHLVV